MSSSTLSDQFITIATNPSSSTENTILFFVIFGGIILLLLLTILVCSCLFKKLNLFCCKEYSNTHDWDEHHNNVICYKITGFINHLIEILFENIGILISKFPYICLIFIVLVTLGISSQIFFIKFEESIFDLWTPTDSPIFKEREFIKKYWSTKDYGLNIISGVHKDNNIDNDIDINILDDKYLNEWFNFHINYRKNLPKKEYTYIKNGTQYSVLFGYFPDNLYDIKNESYLFDLGLRGQTVDRYLSEVIPCM